MAAKRAERLVNLVIALLSTRQFVTAAKIRATVPGYDADDRSEKADEAFKRMFERDKAELREMGVPLETGRTSVFDTEDGYRIARADELPEIHLTGEEAAAVGLALRLWESRSWPAAHSALVKLKAAGVDVDSSRTIPLGSPGWTRRSPPSSPATPPPATAASEFGYQRPDGTCPPPARPAVGRRRLARRWYLVGLDLDRGAPRVFRLSRVVGPRRRPARPGAFEPPAGSTSPRWSPGRSRERSRWWWCAPVGHRDRPAPARDPLGPADDGDDRLQLRTTEPGRLADQLAASGADVVVESPAEVRDAVVAA